MSKIFNIELLPANEGDSLWIEYGDPLSPHRILIDAGHSATGNLILERIQNLNEPVHFDLVVITHVDADHVEGMLPVLSQYGTLFTTDDLWFNGWRHLQEGNLQAFSPVQGEKVTELILSKRIPWNCAFGEKAIVTSESDNQLQSFMLNGGMELTVLSPSTSNLVALNPYWKKACTEAGIDPNATAAQSIPQSIETLGGNIESWAVVPFVSDDSLTNGSSIALLAEYEKKRLFLAGDAHADKLIESIGRLSDDQKKIDGFKLPHHGSKANLSIQLLEAVRCNKFLISTNGTRFKHPDKEAIARIIKNKQDPELVFNYCSDFTKIWNNSGWQQKYNYSVRYLDIDNEDRVLKLI